jgi:hypothetical protein
MGCDLEFEIQVFDHTTKIWLKVLSWEAGTSCAGGPLAFAA